MVYCASRLADLIQPLLSEGYLADRLKAFYYFCCHYSIKFNCREAQKFMKACVATSCECDTKVMEIINLQIGALAIGGNLQEVLSQVNLCSS